ncbi:response regulator [Sphingomonas sp. SUN019]|uniref:response regulator n=1 Tax=Sphingomonas sp. SUN019 TaxID=2937788 RepID=UPI002164ED71|nr:response regulator [Sphingomonas sp. SUN019]UVO49492.1 response regulator [Sphingomonas sp. SUN019]
MEVLFVEDDAMNRRVVKDMLRVVGANMAEAPDAETGLQMIEDGDYTIILMDLRMPGMDGLTAIRHLRARADAKGALPVIVVTADTATDLRERCLKTGADDVIQKPVAMGALLNAMGRMVAKSGGNEMMLD